MLPKISIITPSYNQGQFLEHTINSILGQNYPGLEYFIIDGGSSDNSVDIIKKYSDRLAFWVSEKDHGQAEAINKGLRLAKGEIITWINSDDQLTSGALHKIANLFRQNPDASLIHGQTILTGPKRKDQLRGTGNEFREFRHLSGMSFSQPSSFFTKKILDKVGLLDESLHYGLDYDLFLRIFLNGQFVQTDEVFSKYLLHEKSKTMTVQGKFADEWALIYSKLMRSVKYADRLIALMQELNLYTDRDDSYEAARVFDKEFIEKSFPYFVLNQIIFRYQAAELATVKRLVRFMKDVHPDFVEPNKLNTVYWRSTLLSPALLKFLRAL